MFKGWMAQHQTAKHIFKNRSRSFYRFLECLRPRWSRFRTCGWSGNSTRTRSNPACWVTLWTFCVSSAFLGSSRSLTTFKGSSSKERIEGRWMNKRLHVCPRAFMTWQKKRGVRVTLIPFHLWLSSLMHYSVKGRFMLYN